MINSPIHRRTASTRGDSLFGSATLEKGDALVYFFGTARRQLPFLVGTMALWLGFLGGRGSFDRPGGRASWLRRDGLGGKVSQGMDGRGKTVFLFSSRIPLLRNFAQAILHRWLADWIERSPFYWLSTLSQLSNLILCAPLGSVFYDRLPSEAPPVWEGFSAGIGSGGSIVAFGVNAVRSHPCLYRLRPPSKLWPSFGLVAATYGSRVRLFYAATINFSYGRSFFCGNGFLRLIK